METKNKDKKIAVAVYELLGTAFIMYGLMMDQGEPGKATVGITFAMMILAWNLSGGHFNPAISIGMYVSEKDFGGNIVTLLIMLASQFAGAILGILFGYFSLIDVTYQDGHMRPEYTEEAKVPGVWVGQIKPTAPSYKTTELFTRSWQTFFAMLVSSMILSLGYTSIKSLHTRLCDDNLVNCTLIFLFLSTCYSLDALFGSAGLNTALTTAYIIFEVSQYKTPNTVTEGYILDHYLWAYIFATCLGGALGGLLHMVHTKCSETKGRDNDKEELLD